MPSSSTRDTRYGSSARNNHTNRSNSNRNSNRQSRSDRDRDLPRQRNSSSNLDEYQQQDYHQEHDDGTAYAQQLQEQYRQDFVLRQARRQSQARASAPPAEFVVDTATNAFAPVIPPTYISTTATTAASTTTTDAAGFPLPSYAAAFDEPDIEVMYQEPSTRNPFHNHTSPTANRNDYGNGNGNTNNRDPLDDFEYARQLQMEIEREERLLEEARRRNNKTRSSSNRGSTSISTSTRNSLIDTTSSSNSISHSRYEISPVLNQEWPLRSSGRRNNAPTPTDEDEDEDARLAQQLQDEELARQLAAAATATVGTSSGRERRSSSRPRTRTSSTTRTTAATTRTTAATSAIVAPPRAEYLESRASNNSNHHHNKPPSFRHTSSNVQTNSTDSDTSSDVAARRIAQEMDDAEMAQRLALYEEETHRRRATQRQGSRTSRLVVGRILPLFCVAAAVAIALLFVLGVFDPQDVPLVGDWLDNRNNGQDGGGWIDPWKGKGNGTVSGGGAAGSSPVVDRSEQMGWSSDGRSGVTLEILDATEDKWSKIVGTAVQNWDNGYPVDSLTLSVTKVGYEVECSAVTGKIKVCNADYGATRWRGLNELLLDTRTNTIDSSAAKMNEYYLLDEGYDQQLYTMCHELGHGFGLPHWDENFFNKDLGNCMDYTNNPSDNKTPDESNFEFLRQIYGGIDVATGQSVTSAMAISDGSSNNDNNAAGTVSPQENTDDAGVPKDDKKGGRRRRLGTGSNRRAAATTTTKRDPKNGPRSSSTTGSVTADGHSPPLLQSRVLSSLIDGEQRRRILFANDYVEVHRIALSSSAEEDYDTYEEVDGGDYIKLQYYLLA